MIMEAVFARSSPPDHQYSSSISTYNKKIKNYDPTNKHTRPYCISRTTSFLPDIPHQLVPTNNNFYNSHGSGLMVTHNSPMVSNYNSVSVVKSIPKNEQHKQPPLLPLPVNFRPYMSLPRSHSISVNRSRSDQSSTPRKGKKPTKREDGSKQDIIKKAKSIDTNDYMKIKNESSVSLINKVQLEPTLPPIGPDPNDLPKDVCKVLLLSSSKDLDKVFDLSPPPSSLPLPKFSVRPKLGCNAEATATDSLRQLLRLR